jgi:lysosomal acid lipase/cholesteryl ester hydrolase
MKTFLILAAAQLALATNDAHRQFGEICSENGWTSE